MIVITPTMRITFYLLVLLGIVFNKTSNSEEYHRSHQERITIKYDDFTKLSSDAKNIVINELLNVILTASTPSQEIVEANASAIYARTFLRTWRDRVISFGDDYAHSYLTIFIVIEHDGYLCDSIGFDRGFQQACDLVYAWQDRILHERNKFDNKLEHIDGNRSEFEAFMFIYNKIKVSVSNSEHELPHEGTTVRNIGSILKPSDSAPDSKEKADDDSCDATEPLDKSPQEE